MVKLRCNTKVCGVVHLLLNLRAIHEFRSINNAFDQTILEGLRSKKYTAGAKKSYNIAEFSMLTRDLKTDLESKQFDATDEVAGLIEERSVREGRTLSNAAEITILETLLPFYGQLLYDELDIDVSGK